MGHRTRKKAIYQRHFFFLYGQVDPHGAYIIIHVLKLVMYTEYLLASSIAWRFRFFIILAALHMTIRHSVETEITVCIVGILS